VPEWGRFWLAYFFCTVDRINFFKKKFQPKTPPLSHSATQPDKLKKNIDLIEVYFATENSSQDPDTT
jgi:hypothetical protein